MARAPRLVVPGLPHVITQRGNEYQPIYRDEEDYQKFMIWMKESSQLFKVAIHAYVLMDSFYSLALTPLDEQGLARMMQWLGRHYVPYFNRKYGRSGTLWQGRFRTSLIEPDAYLMRCSRHIEMAPVLAGIVRAPEDYVWSSCAHHVGNRTDGVVVDHRLYWALGNTPFEREVAYKRLLSALPVAGDGKLLGDALDKGRVLGSESFKRQLEKQTGRRVLPANRGRPRKPSAIN